MVAHQPLRPRIPSFQCSRSVAALLHRSSQAAASDRQRAAVSEECCSQYEECYSAMLGSGRIPAAPCQSVAVAHRSGHRSLSESVHQAGNTSIAAVTMHSTHINQVLSATLGIFQSRCRQCLTSCEGRGVTLHAPDVVEQLLRHVHHL